MWGKFVNYVTHNLRTNPEILFQFLKYFNNFLIKFQLSKLSLIHTDINPWMYGSTIETFWNIQAENLTELRIIDSPVEDEEILKVLKLKKLKVFEINLKVLAVNPTLILELAKGFKWKHLNFKAMPFRPEVVRMIIEAHQGEF